MENSRVKVRIGTDEFEAEGPETLVTKQYEAFLAAVAARPKDSPIPQTVGLPAASPLGSSTPLPNAGQGANAFPPGGVPLDVMERVFRQGDVLSLAALPHGENATPDAMLALLYGYAKLKNEQTVTGTSLMKSAKQSGVNVNRVDRAMAANQPEYVLAAGVRKARRYQLNNRGVRRAEEIIQGILQ